MQDPPWILGPPESFQDTPDPQSQLRQDRAREVALHEARSALIPTMINTRADLDNYGAAVKGLAAAFLPFLLGEDKPNL